MIKAALQGKNGPIIFLGLSSANLRKLREGKPVHVDARKLGFEGEIVILFGETEEKIVRDLLAAGIKLPE